MRARGYGAATALVLTVLGVGAILVFLVPSRDVPPPDSPEAARAVTHDEPAPALPGSRARQPVRTSPVAPPPAAAGASEGTADVGAATPGSLFGRIIVAGAGTPVAGVIVSLLARGERRRARTTNEGYFRVSDLPPGMYTVSARTYEIPHLIGSLVLIRPGRETVVLIEADRGVRLHGRITDAVTGRGIAEAEVTFSSGRGGRVVESDEDGGYEIRGVAIGGTIGIKASGYAEPPLGRLRGTNEPGEARMDFALEPPANLEGRVVGPKGESASGARIRVDRADGGPRQNQTADEAGRFRFTGLPANVPLRLRAFCAGYVPAALDVGALDVHEDGSGVLVTLGRGAVIAGRVREPDGDPAFTGTVTLDRVGAIPPDGSRRRVMIHKDGTYRFECVSPGRYALRAWHPGYVSAESVEVEVAEGRCLEATDLVLAQGLTITGRLLDPDGKPVAGGSVVAEPADVPLPLLSGIDHQAASHDDGGFEIMALPPGRYRLTCWSRSNRHMIRPDRVVAAGASGIVLQYTRKPERKGKPRAVDASIDGRVRDSRTGAPVMGFTVVYWRAGDRWVRRQSFVDPEGRFRIDRLSPGTYLFEASTAAGAVTREPVRVVLEFSRTTPAITLRLDRSAEVTGRVMSPRGAPPAEAGIEIMRRLESCWRVEASVISRRDGRYRAQGLAPGEYLIRARHPDWIQAEARTTISVGQTRAIDLEMRARGGTVQVVVRDPAGRPLRDAVVRIGRSDGFAMMRYRDSSGLFELPSFVSLRSRRVDRLGTDASGQVVFSRVPPGPYTVQVFKPGYGFRSVPTTAYEAVTTRVDVVLAPVE